MNVPTRGILHQVRLGAALYFRNLSALLFSTHLSPTPNPAIVKERNAIQNDPPFMERDSPTREEETEDIGIHQLDRLVEQLTSKECEDLLLALSRPEEDIFQHIDRLSPENNQLDVKFRAKRDTSSAADKTLLSEWCFSEP
ncbi:hypothetical protein XENOCAPTIV_011941 [Xenoophorus captivus]|uniref:Uncharacterized protein n=1 Tax=Xenoophorus captivus TaxID=1517983 RepID=A0ABV0SA90_9TELE